MSEKPKSRDFITRSVQETRYPPRKIERGDLELRSLLQLLTVWFDKQQNKSGDPTAGVKNATRMINAIISYKSKQLLQRIQSLRPDEIEPLKTEVIPRVGSLYQQALNAVLVEYQSGQTPRPTATVVTPRSNRK